MKKKKLTVRQRLADANLQLAESQGHNERLITQLSDQNRVLDRARIEGNQLIDKYNKLAGKVNAMRTLVTSND